ncbi:MAG TPA: YdeI/OmpD-associated family protein [bacterium]
MKLGKTLYVTTPKAWRTWLKKNHKTQKEIWLIYYRKESGKPRIAYNDAVDEALCFGWIDSTVKKIDLPRFAQRFTPRKKRSPCSEMNKARARRMIAEGRMTKAGLDALGHEKDLLKPTKLKLARVVQRALQKDSKTWQHFQKFPDSYKRIRIGWIEGSRHRPAFFKTRLRFFVKMTTQNKMFGMVRE